MASCQSRGPHAAKDRLLFLNSRGRHLSEAFSNSDYHAAPGISSRPVVRPFSYEHTVLLHGQITSATYGQPRPWNNHLGAVMVMIAGLGTQASNGLLILEIQKKVLRFRVKCCQLILANLPSDSLTGKNIPIQPDPGPITTYPTVWPSLEALSMEAPYRAPAHLDFQRLQAIMSANLLSTTDHIWALREDPAYFASHFGDYSEHSLEALPDVTSKNDPSMNNPRFWKGMLSKMASSAYALLSI